MAGVQLADHFADDVSQVGAVVDVLDHRGVLLSDRSPIQSVHVRVVEVVALCAPRLLEDLRPLGAWIDEHLELPNVDRPVADFGRLVRRHDAPTTFRGATRSLIEEFLAIAGQCVGADAFEEWRGGALLQLIALEARAGSSVRHRLHVEERSGGAGTQVAEVAGRNPEGKDALADAVKIDANCRRARIRSWLRCQRDARVCSRA